ncbi:MAG: cobalt ECF transporter T component CbiQ [Proteobacteria bacterium]|nr:cobalt ECF transporter T component CbiQ [Desulfobacula sp.]MBU3952003.1 cobalt ECF transporter T component CbiQ [Pseudomonadota bacterium]MBU4133372.1 cobalt ECF transporter T component CbiQ [Pseudomonadota bacterium]
MLENTLGDGSSLIHGLDPKIRILAAVFISVAVALCDNLVVAAGYLALACVLILVAQLPPKEVFKRLNPLFWFLLMIWIFLPLTFGGTLVFEYKFLAVSYPGILLSAKITLKSTAILLVFSALLATMPIAALGSGLHQLKVPDKLVFLLLMTYRYIAVIQEEYIRLLRAANLRGFTPKTNLHSYRTYAFLAGMLFVRASLRAKRVYQAMRCRGFNQRFHSLDVYPPTALNYVFLSVMILAGTGLVAIELTLS